MTLDDFFTLTEMNNGLTVPSRVEELVAVLQKEKDYILKNAGDATRQWSAVAKALSATENKDCLDLFIQLDGLHFISKWLKDAKFNNESSDSLLEESISLLLQALEKLNLDYEKAVVSEIWTAVEDLVHNSSKVQDKARVVFESWERKRDGDAYLLHVEHNEVGNRADVERDGECSLGDASLSKEIFDKEKGEISTENDPVVSLRADVVHTGQVENTHNSVKNDESLDLISSTSLKTPAMEPTSLESCSPVFSRQDTRDGEAEFHELESASDIKWGPEIESSQEQLGSNGEVKVAEEKLLTSGSYAADVMKSATEPDSQIFSLTEDKNFGTRKFDSDEKAAQGSSGASTGKERGEFNHRMLCNSSSSKQSWGNVKKMGTFLSGSESDGKINNLDQHVCDDALKNDHNFSKKETDKKSDIELQYGIVDPLEVARQVAIEVERDHRERSSSSEKLPEGNVRSPESKSHTSEGPPNDERDHSEGKLPEDEPDSSPLLDESMTTSENPEAEQTNETQEIETSQVTENAQEEEANSEKNPCNFDLNEEICLEDHTDHTANQNSTPVPIVSASRAAAAQGLPIAPLQFEGELGWKGSAATSAFRPTSSRRVPEIDKDLTIGGNNLNFDLNVSENVDPSESSLEMSWRKSERLELDLNLTSEDGGPQPDWQMSSSSKQSSLRNFNLNDHPSFLNDASNNSYLNKMPQIYNGVKSDESVISIMGRRVEVNRNDIVPTLSLTNGGNPELGFDFNLVRPGNFMGLGPMIPYSHSAVYGYNNVPSGPAMPYSSAMYGPGGPIPYMVDSRGAPVIPQIVGGASSSMPTAFSQQPFFVNMTSSNGLGPIGPIGPSRSSFDLNSGMMVGNGSRDPSGFSQFLNSGQLRSMDEQLKSNSQPSISSVVGGKRKEPDNGWENYPFKHYTPPWK